jgi:hypothetical protein
VSAATHSPAPWTRDGDREFNVSDANGEPVIWGCGCCGSPDVRNPADEPLIIAAPKLLKALQLVLYAGRFDFNEGDSVHQALQAADAAIADATGSAT